MLPGIDGLEMIRKLRATDRETPILVVSARDKIDQLVSGYPELALRVHKDGPGAGAERYRLLFGDFPTADHAKAAVMDLPQGLLNAVGDNDLLVKASSEPEGPVLGIAKRQ